MLPSQNRLKIITDSANSDLALKAGTAPGHSVLRVKCSSPHGRCSRCCSFSFLMTADLTLFHLSFQSLSCFLLLFAHTAPAMQRHAAVRIQAQSDWLVSSPVSGEEVAEVPDWPPPDGEGVAFMPVAGIATAAFSYPQTVHSSCLEPASVAAAALSVTH